MDKSEPQGWTVTGGLVDSHMEAELQWEALVEVGCGEKQEAN